MIYFLQFHQQFSLLQQLNNNPMVHQELLQVVLFHHPQQRYMKKIQIQLGPLWKVIRELHMYKYHTYTQIF